MLSDTACNLAAVRPSPTVHTRGDVYAMSITSRYGRIRLRCADVVLRVFLLQEIKAL